MILPSYRYAIDTNILVYSISENCKISARASSLLTPTAHVSNFVMQEFLFQLRRNFKLDKSNSMKIVTGSLQVLNLNRIGKDNYRYAHFLLRRYDFSLEDAMVVSDAILNGCTILYSKDMQNGQVVDRKLKIIDPFK